MIAAFVAGVVAWSLLEYVMHRWMGHDRRFKRTPFGVEHIRHHVQGDYFAPTWKKLVAVPPLAAILALPALAFGASIYVAFLAGLLSLYAAYEFLHRREHTHAGIGPYGRWARRHHFHHHFVDGRANHGVTSPVWDFVFGTYQHPSTIRVPRKLCMSWLVDPVTNDVRSEHARVYSLRA